MPFKTGKQSDVAVCDSTLQNARSSKSPTGGTSFQQPTPSMAKSWKGKRSAKYLGIHLDNQLNFNTHVDAISRKAHSIKAFLSRNLSHCSQQVKETAYNTFVLPAVELASSAWDPHTHRNIQKIEQVQLYCCSICYWRLPPHQ